MNIKSLLLLAAIASAGTSVYAQKNNVNKAKTGIAKFEELKAAGTAQLALPNLKTAQEAIDLAIVNDKTKENPEAWTIYSLVYANLATLDKSAEDAKKAEDGIAKAKSYDSDGANKDNIRIAEQVLGQFNFNNGAEEYQGQKYKEAYDSFEKALVYLPGDTTLIYYGGISALQINDYDKAIAKYKQLIPVKEFSSHKQVVVDLPKLFLSAKDTTSALEYAAKAVELYPEDNAAAVQNIEFNLISGREKEIVAGITSQLAKDPNNKSLNYYLGIAQSANKNDEAALEAYKKALAIDPDYFEANTNMAITMMNGVREKLNVLNNDRTLSQAKYNEGVNKIKEEIKPALVYLTKAVELQPTNIDALTNLKNYYIFMQDEAKTSEVTAKIDALN
ncbi:tetratricopeptide repeat protein [Sphingobacterium sp. SG20118]|uniref:tetratricopeptide repeat protein n=1 Tax=Sphingobacterium TaxID=28453 RepID=UPI0024695C97|nr:tetratricopeptide repeat protein [Sphingobacterium faecium]MDH5827072.1 tetratricopeptide repeat protein [Sphingobacterium faecium]